MSIAVDLEQYRIKDLSLAIGSPFKEINCTTVNKGRWNLMLATRMRSPIVPIPIEQLSRILDELSGRQAGTLPSHSSEERNHSENVCFFAANWGQLVESFYSYNVSNNYPPRSFAEVSLDQYGAADFIGSGMDGKLFVIEFGNKRKSSQVARYFNGLVRLMGIGGERLETFVGKYSKNKKATNLIITPPGFEYGRRSLPRR